MGVVTLTVFGHVTSSVTENILQTDFQCQWCKMNSCCLNQCFHIVLRQCFCCRLLARALQAVSDPCCQSTCLSVCLCVGNFDAKYVRN